MKRILLLCSVLLAATVLLAPVAGATRAAPAAGAAKKHCKKTKGKTKKKCKKAPGQVGATAPTTTSQTYRYGANSDSLVPRGTFNTTGVFASIYGTTASGTVKAVEYYADRPGAVRFYLIGRGGYSQTIKAAVDVNVTKAGLGTYTLPTPWTVGSSDGLAMWESAQGPLGYTYDSRLGTAQSMQQTAPGVGATVPTEYIAQAFSFGATVYPPNYKPVRPGSM